MSTTPAPATVEKLKLLSSDGIEKEVARDVAERSILIKNMLEDCGEIDQAIPIPNVTSSVLTKVIEWCEHHKNDPAPAADEETDSRKKSTDIEEWDQKFMQVDQEMLFEIILAAKLSRHQTPSWRRMQNGRQYD